MRQGADRRLFSFRRNPNQRSSTQTAGGLGNATPSQWSGYRLHWKDPLWFEDGVQMLVRNGGAVRPFGPGVLPGGGGSGKCYNLDPDPGYFRNITVTSTAWSYEW
eukprot:SAG22_NODE_9211_length_603_cov_0.656746_1_plen_105_part_00